MQRRAIFIGWVPSALDGARGLRRINTSGWQAVVVTNRGGGDRLRADLLEEGARLDAIYSCPHPSTTGCACRKPGSGLLERAREEMGIDLASSYFIGAGPDDLLTAQTAGIPAILVGTAAGCATPDPVFVAATFEGAVAWALDQRLAAAGES